MEPWIIIIGIITVIMTGLIVANAILKRRENK